MGYTGEDLPTKGTHIALCSGGRESTVAAHIACRWGPCEFIVYLDTGTGIEANRRFVERVADTFGVPFLSIRTPEDYNQLVKEELGGFPGPSKHREMYQALKDRSLGRIATLVGGRGTATADELHFWTGVRMQESEKRMAHVERVDQQERWTFVSPIYDWSDVQVKRYHRRMNLPTNYLWSTLGRSGDCFCGCFGSPEELIDAEAAGATRLVENLRDLEEQLAEEYDRIQSVWGWGGMSETEVRAHRAEQDPEQMLLCSTCGTDYPIAEGGDDE